jgi:hypothetical protein
MKLYVCYGTFGSPRPGGHPCKNAYDALRAAGHEPEVVRSYGAGVLPDFLNRTSGRREAKRLTGKTWVPVMVTDGGEAIYPSEAIVAWADGNPAAAQAAPSAAAEGPR